MNLGENARIARQIVLGYLNMVTHLSEEEKLHEIAWVNVDDKVLLEHINKVIKVMTKAKEELEGAIEGDKDESSRSEEC